MPGRAARGNSVADAAPLRGVHHESRQMKIDFVRSGGFAGLRLALRMDTETLPAEDASRIAQLVEAAGFFETEREGRAEATDPDRFQYHLTIESQVWGRRTLDVGEAAVDPALHPLLDHLTAAAMRAGRTSGAADQ